MQLKGTYSAHPHLLFELKELGASGLRLVSVTDTRTGVVVRSALPHPSIPYPSVVAFAGARYSRSSKSVEDILEEVVDSSELAEQKLAAIFRGYGHASVADMAVLFSYIENIPSMHAFRFFYESSVGAGQERSTRYQDFGTVTPLPLEKLLPPHLTTSVAERELSKVSQTLMSLQAQSLELFRKWTATLTKRFSETYRINPDHKGEMGALRARVFDTSRSFLLTGLSNRTSLAWITSAREWARIIALFKGDGDPTLNCIAEQLEALYAPSPEFAKKLSYVPEAAELIRYTSADETTGSVRTEVQSALEELGAPFLEKKPSARAFNSTSVSSEGWNLSAGYKSLAQLCQDIAPWSTIKEISEWLVALEDGAIAKLSNAAFSPFSHHQQMGAPYRTNQCSLTLTCSIAEARDLNRHRAWGRFTPFLTSRPTLKLADTGGFTLPLYLTENPDLRDEHNAFVTDLVTLYAQVDQTISTIGAHSWLPHSLALQCLPFAHAIPFSMHGSVKELSYLSQLRVRPGGHINYRVLAHEMAERAAKEDPTLQTIVAALPTRPDATSRLEFIDRS